MEHGVKGKRRRAQGTRELRDGRERRERQTDGFSDLNESGEAG